MESGALLRQAELSDITATYVLERIRAIAEDLNARHADRLRARELLGKHLKLFTDRAEQDTQRVGCSQAVRLEDI